MLVLSRRVNETIVINNEIFITVVSLGPDKVRIGIEAPREAAVHRREVWEAIRRADDRPPVEIPILASSVPPPPDNAALRWRPDLTRG